MVIQSLRSQTPKSQLRVSWFRVSGDLKDLFNTVVVTMASPGITEDGTIASKTVMSYMWKAWPVRQSPRKNKKLTVALTAILALLLLASFLTLGYSWAKSVYRSFVGTPPEQIHWSWSEDSLTTLTAVWHTRRSNTPSLIRYRLSGSQEWRQAIGEQTSVDRNGVLHTVTLRHLDPNQIYDYQIKGDVFQSVWSPVYTIRSAPADLGFDVIYMADTGLSGRQDGLSTGTDRVVSEVSKQKPLMVLAGGDYAYFSSDKQHGSLEKSIAAWMQQMQPIAVNSVIMPTYGNHEAVLRENYSLWAHQFVTPPGIEGHRNYSFDVGKVHFISLFAVYEQQGVEPEVLDWLEADIQQAQILGQKWIIPFMHVSAFAEGASHPSNLELRSQLGPIFERWGIKVVLSSHDQAYERTYPLIKVPEENEPTTLTKKCYGLNEGTTWVKTSPGGKESSKSGSFSILPDQPSSWVAVRDNKHHVFTKLHFDKSGALSLTTFGVKDSKSSMDLVDSFKYTPKECSVA